MNNAVIRVASLCLCAISLTATAFAESPNAANFSLGGAQLTGWIGLTSIKASGSHTVEAKLPVGAPAIYTAPKGPKGWYQNGLTRVNDSTIDCRDYFGLRFDAKCESDKPVDLVASVRIPGETGCQNLLPSAAAHIRVSGAGWHTVTIPWTAFDYKRGQADFIAFVQQIELKAISDKPLTVRNLALTRGDVLYLDCAISSKPADGDAATTYTVNVTNCTDAPQSVLLSQQAVGWEAMTTSVTPTMLDLAPWQSLPVTVTVNVPSRIPPGGRETQTIVATPSCLGRVQGRQDRPHHPADPTLPVHHNRSGWMECDQSEER